MSDTALTLAIRMAGGPKALGERIGISSQAISQWVECPPRRVIAVEAASGVSRHELRPDLYPLAGPSAALPQVVSAHQ
ncbi:YdaS family helix-turn-helix protein [Methylobacterium sp. WL19]|uniref:transcriptional regulator n=1 Tax=Methylobacterium sp. WL19 TaxID=2603896 RepID=UPI0011C98639|nr:helix-turn-helix domain-containing protein [Methylobacterium sp. WL19]